MSANRKRLAEEWFAKGEEDLAAASVLSTQPATAALALFHCQQAVEKHLKGLLALCGQPPPRTHDLSLLLQMCATIDRRLARFASRCELLTTFYNGNEVSRRAEPGFARECQGSGSHHPAHHLQHQSCSGQNIKRGWHSRHGDEVKYGNR
jgi:HEPN domain-containing protein